MAASSGSFGIGDGNQVLDPLGFIDLTSDPFSDDCGFQAFAGGVDGCGNTGRSATDNGDVVIFGFVRYDDLMTIMTFKFVEQLGQTGLADMDHLVTGKKPPEPPGSRVS